MNEERKNPVWPWIVAVLISLPVLYVLSSGPMQAVAFRRIEFGTLRFGEEVFTRCYSVDRGTWWPHAYGPLVWTSERQWGKPVILYWNLFPIRANQSP